MILSNLWIHEINKHEMQLSRLCAIVAIVAFAGSNCLYCYHGDLGKTSIMGTVVVIVIYLIFFSTTVINRFKKYMYFLAVISIYATTLDFIYQMVIMNFLLYMVLTVSLAITVLASFFDTEKMMNSYLLSMILISIALLLIYSEYSTYMVLNIVVLIIWPLLSYYTLKSKYINRAEISKKAKFLKMVFESIDEPTIIIDCITQKIVDCNESTILTFKLNSYDETVGKTIREINELHLNGSIDNNKLQEMVQFTNETFEIELTLDGEPKVFKIMLNKFIADEHEYMLYSIADITEKINQNKQIYDLAFADELTKIANRRKGMNTLKYIFLNYDSRNSIFAVYLIDIDDFKAINDNYGHDCGDIVLQTVANRLLGSISENSFVSRIGGDEFMIIVEDLSDIEMIDGIAQQIIEHINMPIKISEGEVTISISIGISIYPSASKDYKELLRRSDMALYHSKKLGGNRYTISKE